jgi:hypothetical protein
VNEGIADYFGEALFTGDDMITRRHPRVAAKADQNRRWTPAVFKPIDELMQLGLEEWNREMSLTNYDQAWSNRPVSLPTRRREVSARLQRLHGCHRPRQGSQRSLASRLWRFRGLEDRWKQFWTALPENPTEDLYRRATVETFTSYLARAWSPSRPSTRPTRLNRRRRTNALKCTPQDRLPRALMAQLVYDLEERAKAGDRCGIEYVKDDKWPHVVLETKDGKRLVGGSRSWGDGSRRRWNSLPLSAQRREFFFGCFSKDKAF